jgi:phosphoglycerate-specific signal transduction histidine kinase
MNKLIDYLIAFLQNLKQMDKARFHKEMRDLAYYINRQVFSQIPSVSAISGLLVGSWVVSTFTTSPLRGVLASWGLMKGGTHVVSSSTYKVLSLFLPILATAVTAYLVQKVLKNYREKRLQRDMAQVAQLEKDVQAELRDKMNILSKARETGLISESEFHTKTASLYQSYTRAHTSKIEEFLINKIG